MFEQNVNKIEREEGEASAVDRQHAVKDNQGAICRNPQSVFLLNAIP